MDRMQPAHNLASWARSMFIEDGGKLYNPDHAHLQQAEIGFLWAGIPNQRRQSRVIGQCEPGLPQMMGAWAKQRTSQQLEGWFGTVPDFIITIDAQYAFVCEDAQLCALVEHELYHAGVELDEFGAPRFNKNTGAPKFAMRPHDVEEFVGVVRRYGSDAAGVRQLVEAANRPPEVASVHIAQACGSCKLRIA